MDEVEERVEAAEAVESGEWIVLGFSGLSRFVVVPAVRLECTC